MSKSPPLPPFGGIHRMSRRDALFGLPGGADLLLPRVDLGALLPDAALDWLARHDATLHLGTRVDILEPGGPGGAPWRTLPSARQVANRPAGIAAATSAA